MTAQEPLREARATRLTLVREGAAAGLVLSLADVLATGPWRAPMLLHAVVLAMGLVGGLVAGSPVAPSRRRGLAAGLVLVGAVALQGASVVSKQLGGRAALLGAVVLFALACGAVAFGAGRRQRRPVLAAACGLVGVPAGSLLGVLAAPGMGALAGLVVALCVPLVLAGLGLVARPRVVAAVGIVVAALLPLPVLALDPEPAPGGDAVLDGPAQGGSRPDVVLVVVDTLRADAVDWTRDNSFTPNLAALAAGGVRFEQAISAAPWTLPAMASLFTGLLPSQHGAVDRAQALSDEATTLAERFHEAGYRTAAFTGGAFVDPGYGMAQGFEHFDPRAEYHFRPLRLHVPLAWRVVKNRYLPLRFVLHRINEFGGLEHLRAELFDWLEESGAAEETRPLFLLVHTYQVHDYYIYHPDTDDGVHRSRGGPPASVGHRLTVHPEELFELPAEAIEWFEHVYGARLAHVDRELGRLLRGLHAARAGRERIVALTSDHGEGFDAERERLHHGGRLHDDLLRIPLVLAHQGEALQGERLLEPGGVVPQQVRLVDVAPTLLELAGLQSFEDVAGRSLLGALWGEEDFPEYAWAEEHMTGPRWRALRAPPWKLIEGRAGASRYALDEDPAERRPLEFDGIEELVRRWRSFDERYPRRMRANARVGASVLQQLKDIGYGP